VDFQSVLVTRSYEQVVQQIRERIRAGALVPGQRLPTERELSDSFNVSRGVVREALKVLTSMGLVESRQGSGTYIRTDPIPSISRALTLSATTEPDSLLSLLELREPVEVAAARFAAQRRSPDQAEALRALAEETAIAARHDDIAAFGRGDNEFHLTISEASQNAYLSLIVGAVRDVQSNVVALIVSIPGSMHIASEHHRTIAEAIEAADPDESAARMTAHVRYSAQVVRELLAKPESERSLLGWFE
jgi:GntR family transcriptional repressor for pyruvate dehydrogenase complex